MKKAVLLVLLPIIVLKINAQNITGKLAFAGAAQLKEGLLVYGIDESSGKELRAIIYDKNLKEIYHYSKHFDGNFKIKYVSAQTGVNNQISIYICSNLFCNEGSNLVLNEKLEEESFVKYAKADVQKAKKIFKTEKYNYLNTPFPRRIESNTSTAVINVEYTPEQESFLKKDWFFVKYPADTLTFSRNSISKTQLCHYKLLYDTKWETTAKTKVTKIGYYEIIACDEKNEFVLVNDKDDKIIGHDYLYCLNSATGEFKWSLPLVLPETKENLYFNKCYFDNSTGKLILSGTIIPGASSDIKFSFNSLSSAIGLNNETINMTGLFMMIVNDKGNIEKSKKIDFPEYNIEEPSSYNFKYKSAVVKQIGKLPNGDYFINCENRAFCNLSGGTGPLFFKYYEPIGFSRYILNDKFDILTNQFYIFTDYDRIIHRYYGSSANGDVNLVSSTKLSSWQNSESVVKKNEIIDFRNVSGAKKIELFSYKCEAATFSDYIGYCDQFLMDEKIVIFFSKTKNDGYELKLMKF